MIKIKRTTAPEFLNSKEVRKALDILAKRFEDQYLQSRMRFDNSILQKVKPDLMTMCNDKCAYCESGLGATQTGDVDNFRPKSGAKGLDGSFHKDHYWWLAYEWDNLLMSCQVCNRKFKRNFFPLKEGTSPAAPYIMGVNLRKESALLIDPCHDEPSDHLEYDSNGRMEPLTEKGAVTIKLLGLNRLALVSSRQRKLATFKEKLESLENDHEVKRPKRISSIINFIKDLLSENPTPEYAGLLRFHFNQWLIENADIWANLQDVEVSKVAIKYEKKVEAKEIEKIEKVKSQIDRIKLFTIKSVTIKNFKSIENLSLEFKPSEDKDQESWFLLLGDNGIGKSSILKSITLCLAGGKVIKKLNLDVLEILKRGTEKGSVIIEGYEQEDRKIRLDFDKNGFVSSEEDPVCFTLAYGATRLLPKGNIQPGPKNSPYVNVWNLFDYSYSLENTKLWLQEIGEDEFNNRIAPALIDLLMLQGNDTLTFRDKTLYITHHGEEHRLDQMSDGYRAVAGLALDIMFTLSLERADFHHTAGLVMIDELGSHLHPRWKVKIVSSLKAAFPKLQFIVTSHEPLCLRGLESGEVGVLIRDKQRKVKMLGPDLLPDHTLMTLEQLLTSDLFGLLNVMDEKVIRTYEEYYALLRKKEKSKEDDKRIIELSSEISSKELIGATPAQQAHYEIIQKEYVEKLISDGFKTTEELKEETRNEAKKIIDKKNFNWL